MNIPSSQCGRLVACEVSAGYGGLALVELPAIDLLAERGWSHKTEVLKSSQYRGRSKRGEIHARIGAEIPERSLRAELASMVQAGLLTPRGEAGGRRYELTNRG